MKTIRQIFNVKDYQGDLSHFNIRDAEKRMNILVLSSNENGPDKITENEKNEIKRKVLGTPLEELSIWEETKKRYL